MYGDQDQGSAVRAPRDEPAPAALTEPQRLWLSPPPDDLHIVGSGHRASGGWDGSVRRQARIGLAGQEHVVAARTADLLTATGLSPAQVSL